MANDTAKAPRLPYLPWFASDFAATTREWPLIARGVYRELLDASWQIGSLPDDQVLLRSMIRATPAEWKKAWPWVGPKWTLCEDGRLRNERLESHREKSIRKHDQAREAANARHARNATVNGHEE